MERMGHTSPAIALRYQHVMANRQAAVAAALDRLTLTSDYGDERPVGGHVEGTSERPAKRSPRSKRSTRENS
jgi:hypothetical protein